jgi:D-xylose 1-dehydrogenase (NADP+, D-xylono-1,5-lactone-forming)
VNDPVRWGILSTARINRLVIPAARASDKLELVGVASRDQARAEEYARQWEIPRAYGSYEALLADDEIEAVYISLPNNLHAEWSIRSLEAGKHVLCEKPMGKRAAEIERAFDVAERTGLLLSEAFMYRHNPQARRLRELLDEGAIGEPRIARARFGFALFDTANIRLRPDVEGGSLMDVGCYCVNGLRLVAGEPELVFGQQLVGPSGTDWVFTGSLRFPGEVFGFFDCWTSLPERDELEVLGTEGSLFLDDPWHAREPVIEVRRDGGTERIELEQADSYLLELENVSGAIRGEGELLLGRSDAVGNARGLEALAASASKGVSIQPGSESAPS